MAHWHDHNPWADRLIYLPDLEELSACLDSANPTRHLDRWLNEHSKLDAYLIRNPNGFHSCGLRYGPEEDQYLSPQINEYLAELLMSKYSNAGAK